LKFGASASRTHVRFEWFPFSGRFGRFGIGAIGVDKRPLPALFAFHGGLFGSH